MKRTKKIHIRWRMIESRGVDITPRQVVVPFPQHEEEPPEGLNIPDEYFRPAPIRMDWRDWLYIAAIITPIILALIAAYFAGQYSESAVHLTVSEWPPAVERHIEFREELSRRVCRDCDVAQR